MFKKKHVWLTIMVGFGVLHLDHGTVAHSMDMMRAASQRACAFSKSKLFRVIVFFF